MRVLIINTSGRTGGAAVAANRLMEALNNNGEKAKMLVCDKDTDQITVVGLHNGLRRHLNFLWERWCIFVRMHFSKKNLFEVDIANAGMDITKLREFKEADVIHLSWINQGMLSLKGIRKILESGKPVVWTMHDFWPSTGICHYPRTCKEYRNGTCRNCRYLPGGGSEHDMSYRVWKKKARIWHSHNIIFVACSKWLAANARSASLLAGKQVTAIPNPIDTRIFRPCDKTEARMNLSLPQDKRLILFVSQRITDRRKGMDYFVEACGKLAAEHPEMCDSTGVVILGGHAEDYEDRLPFTAYPLGYVSDEKKIVDVYNAVDLFVLPSLEDNLPNTIMEAMACGVPCVGFNVGGIPEMIDHRKNGYVAEYRNSSDLAAGMAWTLENDGYAGLCENAVRKVAASYSQQSVALRYIEVYNQAIAYRHYKI
ncbi:glycosyltransferase [Prevotella sp. PCHR]|mgnify:CR=1 FL=1|uniref:Glycosyltransferase n=1 Tax=Xylanibacter caecicola TaxID=2736294 RepID=A0ABX2B4Y5_9BACT|nr:glycosyltransferase family 4 protein [Xylanibacter caecicola]NPE25838.1 glycosyltransferase [Xylanibacter caecicola]